MTIKEIKSELQKVSNLSTVSQIVKYLNKMKEENKISGFSKFKDGINIYKKNSSDVIFEISF